MNNFVNTNEQLIYLDFLYLESGSGFDAEAIPCGDVPDNSALALLITLALALAKAENLVPSGIVKN